MALPLNQQLTNWLRGLSLTGGLADLYTRFVHWVGNSIHDSARQLMDAAAKDGSPVGHAIAEAASAFTFTPHTASYTAALSENGKLNTQPEQYIADLIRRFGNNPNLAGLEQTLGDIGLHLILEPLEQSIATGEDNPIALVARMQGTLSAIALTLGTLGTVAEITGLGQIEGVNEIAAKLSEIYGTSELTAKLLEPLMEAGVNEPATRYFNKKYRPGRLSVGEADALFFEAAINEAEYTEILSVHGFRDHDIALKIEQVYEEIPIGTILNQYHLRQIDAAEAIAAMRQKGLRASDAAKFLAVEDGTLLETQYSEAIRIANSAYQKGLLSKDKFTFIMRAARRGEDEIAIRLAVGDMAIADANRDINVGNVEAAFKQQVLAESEARHYMDGLDIDPAAQSLLIATWKAQVAPKPLLLNAGTITQAMNDGLLSKAEAAVKLQALGWKGVDLQLILDVAEKRNAPVKLQLGEGSILSAFARGILTGPQAKQKLIEIGHTDIDADSLIRWTLIKPAATTKPLDASVIIKLLNLEAISENQAIDRLAILGYDRADAELFIVAETTKLPAAAKKTKPLTAAQIVKGINNDVFTVDEGLEELFKLGYSAQDAVDYLQIAGLNLALADYSDFLRRHDR